MPISTFSERSDRPRIVFKQRGSPLCARGGFRALQCRDAFRMAYGSDRVEGKFVALVLELQAITGRTSIARRISSGTAIRPLLVIRAFFFTATCNIPYLDQPRLPGFQGSLARIGCLGPRPTRQPEEKRNGRRSFPTPIL